MEDRARGVITILESLLSETISSAALYLAKETTAANELDRSHAYGMRLWCEGRACAYRNAISEVKEAFDTEGGDDEP